MRQRPGTPFSYHDRGRLATVGRAAAVADLGRVQLSGWPAWMTWLVVHIWQLIGFRSRIIVMVEWAYAYVTRQRAMRLILPAIAPGETRPAGRPRSRRGPAPARMRPAARRSPTRAGHRRPSS